MSQGRSRQLPALVFVSHPDFLLLQFVSGAGYTFGAGVVRKFLEMNNMSRILRAHQLCMEGFQNLFDDQLTTVWSAPNYCYRCGNMASIMEYWDGLQFRFNPFDAAPENERDGPNQQVAQSALTRVSSLDSLIPPPSS